MNVTWSSKKLPGMYALLIVGCVAALLASFSLISYAAMVQCGPPPPPQCDPDSGAGFTRGPGGTDNCSPIIIDVSGEGFELTSVEQGVQFDIAGTGKPVQIAWTAPGSRNAFLVLDRDGDEKITSGREVFGNFSPQPSSPAPNGFLALAEYDRPEEGGNGDGIIDSRDAIFSDLRLWIDLSHDGISQPNELFKLADLRVFSISLDYQESRRTDQYGNLFRYRAKINVGPGQRDQSEASPAAYDVFLVTK